MRYIYETASEDYALLKDFADYNKKNPTESESILWGMICNRRLGTKFRRQHIIGSYIADFVSLRYKLIIEIDGLYHLCKSQITKDQSRTEDLEEMGFKVIRFTNEEVIGNPQKVLNEIKQSVMEIGSKGSPLLSEGLGEAPDRALAYVWAVDAACSGNPGPMEYRCIDLTTRQQVFHFGPVHGTNNIGEFLAIVHALALLDKQGIKDATIYSDSYNAILWVQKKQCKTKLEHTPETAKLYEIIARAEHWLRTHSYSTKVEKWDTKEWGEIPADFGRK